MRCKVCGAECREGSRFCGSCGAPLAEGGTPGSAPRPDRSQGGNAYGGVPQRGNSYGRAPQGGNAYGRTPQGRNAYGEAPQGGNAYGGAPQGGNQYGRAPQGGNAYGGAPQGGSQYGRAPQGGNAYGRAPQGGNSYDGTPYGGNVYGGSGNAADFQGEYAGRKPKKKHHYGVIGIVAAVVIIAAVAAFFVVRGLGGSSYEKVVEKAINSVFDGDIKALVDLLPPDMMDNAMAQEGISQSELDSQIDQMGDMLKNEMKSLSTEYGDDWKISQKILSETDVTGTDLEVLQDDYSEINVKVAAAKELNVEISISGSEGRDSNTVDLYVVKVGNSWYLDANSFSDIF